MFLIVCHHHTSILNLKGWCQAILRKGFQAALYRENWGRVGDGKRTWNDGEIQPGTQQYKPDAERPKRG